MATRSPKELRAVLDDAGVTFSDCIEAFGDDNNHPSVVIARDRYHMPGEVEIGWPTIVSAHENGTGDFVMAWLWIPKPEQADTDSLPMPLEP